MKLQFHCFHLIPVLAAGLMISPLAAQSPDRPGPPRGDNPREAPQPDRIQAAVRQMTELRQAGKQDEAQAIAQRLREAAKGNPEIAKQLAAAMGHQRPEAKREDRRPDAPRPNAAEAPKRPEARPPAPPAPERDGMHRGDRQPEKPVIRPNAPQPQPPVVRPNAARAQAAQQGQHFNMPGPSPMQAPGHQMMPPGMPQGRQNAMRAPFQLQARQHLMQQRFAPQGRGAAMAMRMQARKHLMQQPYLQHGRNSAMRQFMQVRGSAQPMMRPTASCPPQCPMMRQAAAGPKPPVVRPKVEAAKRANAATGEVAKIRHLRQAAVHLAGAGLAEHAAKANAEADRMTAALKAKPQAPAAKPQPDKPQPDKAKPDKAKPTPDRKPDVNAAILGELRKMGKQMGDLSDRVRKLEAQKKSDR